MRGDPGQRGPGELFRSALIEYRTMRLRRYVANFGLKYAGLRHLHNSAPAKVLRAFLDEIDLQYLRDNHHCPAFMERADLYRHVHDTFVKGAPIDYLEFGVYRGDSIRCWSELNRHPDSRFCGFDSFEGLPVEWRAGQGKGHFNVNGNLPQIEDSRVRFVKGWFDNTVPEFARQFSSSRQLILHLDADLYGSTMLPLIYLTPFLRKGSLLLFDEFYDREHEFKSFVDWQRISQRNFGIVGQVANYGKICAEIR